MTGKNHYAEAESDITQANDCDVENPVYDNTAQRGEVLIDADGDPIVTVKVTTDLGTSAIHDFVVWRAQGHDGAGRLDVYDARTGVAAAAYAAGAWLFVEVLRVWRRGDDPPEAET